MTDRVLVLGGGLAGVACAHKLGDEGVDVTLVDRNDYHQFQPLLYQVASSQLPAEDIARPHRTIFKDYPSVTVVTADVTAAQLAERSLVLADGRTLDRVARGDGGGRTAELLRRARCRRARVPAVLRGRRRAAAAAPAATASGEHRRAMVRASRARSTSSWSAAARPASRPTGALAELMHALATTGRIERPGQITIVDRGQALLGPFSSKAHEYAHRKLTEAGAVVQLETGVSAVHADRVEFDDGSTIPARTVGVGWRRVRLGRRAGRRPDSRAGRAARRPSRPDRRRLSRVSTRWATWRTSRPEMKLPRSCLSWGRSRSSPAGGRQRTSCASFGVSRPSRSRTRTRASWR